MIKDMFLTMIAILLNMKYLKAIFIYLTNYITRLFNIMMLELIFPYGIGVERIFMLHSPQVASLKVERRGKVRRAKLFYLRDRVGKATRVKQRFDR